MTRALAIAARLERAAAIAGPDDYALVDGVTPDEAREIAALLRRMDALEPAALLGMECAGMLENLDKNGWLREPHLFRREIKEKAAALHAALVQP